MTMPTTVRLSPELEARLDRLAARTGRSKAFYLRQMIEHDIDRIEWEFDVIGRADVFEPDARRPSPWPRW